MKPVLREEASSEHSLFRDNWVEFWDLEQDQCCDCVQCNTSPHPEQYTKAFAALIHFLSLYTVKDILVLQNSGLTFWPDNKLLGYPSYHEDA